MTFQQSVARFLLDPKYLNKSVIHNFRTRNIPSVELNTLFSVHKNNHRAFSIGSCLPSLFSKTFYDSICLHVTRDEPLKRKTFNKQVNNLNSTLLLSPIELNITRRINGKSLHFLNFLFNR